MDAEGASSTEEVSGARAQSLDAPAAAPVVHPPIVLHAPVVDGEELVKIRAAVIDRKEVKPRTYHGALSANARKQNTGTVYDMFRDEIEKMKQLALNVPLDSDDVRDMLGASLSAKRATSMLPLATAENISQRSSKCRLCGWPNNDHRRPAR